MTPEKLRAIRTMSRVPEVQWASDVVHSLITEVDRLNKELAEARLTAEEAWENYDRVTETR